MGKIYDSKFPRKKKTCLHFFCYERVRVTGILRKRSHIVYVLIGEDLQVGCIYPMFFVFDGIMSPDIF